MGVAIYCGTLYEREGGRWGEEERGGKFMDAHLGGERIGMKVDMLGLKLE